MKTMNFAMILAVVTAFSFTAQAQQNDPCSYLLHQQRGPNRTDTIIAYGATIGGEVANRYGYSQAGNVADTAVWNASNERVNQQNAETQRYQGCLEQQRELSQAANDKARIDADERVRTIDVMNQGGFSGIETQSTRNGVRVKAGLDSNGQPIGTPYERMERSRQLVESANNQDRNATERYGIDSEYDKVVVQTIAETLRGGNCNQVCMVNAASLLNTTSRQQKQTPAAIR